MMRKIILSINVTEDGFIAGPDGELAWHFPFWDLQMCKALCEILSKADTILLGRKTYVALAGYWTMPGVDLALAREDIALVEMLNRYKKVVVSHTLIRLPWMNSCLLQGDVLDATCKLKQKSGKDIVVLGSSSLVSYLIKHNLIDEYCLWMHPVSIKRGIRLSEIENIKSGIKPLYTQYFNSGVVKTCYQVIPAEEKSVIIS